MNSCDIKPWNMCQLSWTFVNFRGKRSELMSQTFANDGEILPIVNSNWLGYHIGKVVSLFCGKTTKFHFLQSNGILWVKTNLTSIRCAAAWLINLKLFKGRVSITSASQVGQSGDKYSWDGISFPMVTNVDPPFFKVFLLNLTDILHSSIDLLFRITWRFALHIKSWRLKGMFAQNKETSLGMLQISLAGQSHYIYSDQILTTLSWENSMELICLKMETDIGKLVDFYLLPLS